MATETAAALPRTAYTVAEVATSLHIPYKAALRLVQEKRIRSIWTGRQYVIPCQALDDFLASAD
ncbi:helix-turn-helix domain-containing protein [Pseudonocardia sp.]|uniref:helix-turn-helix domain-containing protein n=1 Tax=Pseudonocardia sp. TaxID=60912 RepID=UPI003D0C0C49